MPTGDRQAKADRPARATWALASLVPFVLLALAALLAGRESGWFSFLLDAFRTWSAIMLAFLGGIRRGVSLRNGGVLVLVAFAPALLGWMALFAPVRIGIAILLLAHCGQGAWDSLSASRGQVPRWFGHLRMLATLAIAAAHIAFFVMLS